jgi:hypothetical protein
MFSKPASTKERVYLGLVIAFSVGSFYFFQYSFIFYIMAFLIFLGGVIFRKPTKRQLGVDVIGLCLLWLIIAVGNRIF